MFKKAMAAIGRWREGREHRRRVGNAHDSVNRILNELEAGTSSDWSEYDQSELHLRRVVNEYRAFLGFPLFPPLGMRTEGSGSRVYTID